MFGWLKKLPLGLICLLAYSLSEASDVLPENPEELIGVFINKRTTGDIIKYYRVSKIDEFWKLEDSRKASDNLPWVWVDVPAKTNSNVHLFSPAEISNAISKTKLENNKTSCVGHDRAAICVLSDINSDAKNFMLLALINGKGILAVRLEKSTVSDLPDSELHDNLH